MTYDLDTLTEHREPLRSGIEGRERVLGITDIMVHHVDSEHLRKGVIDEE